MRKLFIICIVLSSCAYSTPEPKSTGNFPPAVSAIIEADCLGSGCHNTATVENSQLDLSSWQASITTGYSLNEIIPFSALKSHFFGHLNTDSTLGPVITPIMPSDEHPLSKADQMIFFNWINEGAKSADGKIPYSDVTKKIFVINQSEDMFSVIDGATGRIARIERLGDTSIKYHPSAIAMMPDRKSFIVGMLSANGVMKKYDEATYSLLGEFNSNLVPNQIALTTDGSKGYITDNSSPTSNLFGIFNAQAMTLSRRVSSPLIIQPFSVVISPDGKYAYMSGYNSDNILRIDTRTDSIVGNLPLGSDVEIPVSPDYIRQYLPSQIVISADSKKMYVTCVETSEVVVFDLEKDSIISRIRLPYSPRAEALSPDGSELWAATWFNTVHIINTTTNTIIAEIDSISQSPHDMTFTSDGKYVYIACEYLLGGHHHHSSAAAIVPSSYVVIDRASRKVLSITELPGFSVGIARGF